MIKVEGGIFDVRRTGKIAGHRIQQRLHAFVLVGRSHENGGHLPRQRSPADGLNDQCAGDRLLFQDRLRQFIGKHGCGIDHFLPHLSGLGHHFPGNLGNADTLAVFSLKIESLHGQQIDNALEVRFQRKWDLHGHGIVSQFRSELADHAVGGGAAPVAFVDKGNTWHPVALHLVIHRDRLRLNAAHGAEH